MQPELDFSRGAQNEVSREMHERIKATKPNMRQIVLDALDGLKCTLEVAESLNTQLHKISGRISELKHSNSIKAIGVKDYKGSKYTIYQKTKN